MSTRSRLHEQARGSFSSTCGPADALLQERPADALAGEWLALSKPGLRGRKRWRWTPAGAAAPVYVKQYTRCGLSEQLDRLLRQRAAHSRAWWEFEQCAKLAESDIAAPQPLLMAERMTGLIERSSALVLGTVAGDAFDRAWREASRQRQPTTRGWARIELTRRLARFVAAFHSTGLCHRDLYLCHVFLDWKDFGRPPLLSLIDLARSHRPRWRRMRWVLKDLAQLDSSARQLGASQADRLRFLRAYLGLERRAPRVRWYARRISRWSARILAREARKGRL